MRRRFPLLNEKLPVLWHGGDYNPDQWPADVVDEDMRLMKLAHVNVGTVGVFSWAQLQPAPDRFTFEWMDRVLDKLAEAGRFAVLATPTAAQPAWLSRLHPDVLRAGPDGRRRHHGARVNYCPNSASYRAACRAIVRELAGRYGQHPALLAWHVSNEYGGTSNEGYCWCDTCARTFRQWLQNRYGSLDALNRAWWTAFWSHTYSDWSQVEPPYVDGEFSIGALHLDWHRFNTASQLGCYLNELQILRQVTPDVPVTTNLMGFHQGNDCREWAPHLDMVSWDSYPLPGSDPASVAAAHQLTYGLKRRPFLLMESSPSSTNWQNPGRLKRPGQLRLWSWQAVANGAYSVMYFQWRAGRGGHEKLHGAVVQHAGHEHTRVFREVAELGAEMEKLGDAVLGAAVRARVGIVYDWEASWILGAQAGFHRSKQEHYRDAVLAHYRALWRRNVPAHIIGPDVDLADYDVVAAPMLYMLRPGWAAKVEDFVRAGGTYVSTYLAGWVNETDLAYTGGYPGPLRKVVGIWAEECDALFEDETKVVRVTNPMGTLNGDYTARRYCELSNIDTARVLAVYGEDFYEGRPVLTVNEVGNGRAYYIAAEMDDAFLMDFYRALCEQKGIGSLMETPEGVEVQRRCQADTSFLFVLNHNESEVQVNLGTSVYRDMLEGERQKGVVDLPPYGVLILEEPRE